MIYIKFINYIVNFITIQPEPTTSKNQDIEGNNKPPGLKNFPYHQQGNQQGYQINLFQTAFLVSVKYLTT